MVSTSLLRRIGSSGLVLILALAVGCGSHNLDSENNGPDGSGDDIGTDTAPADADGPIDGDNDGYADDVDCDDSDDTIHPAADEICDGKDNDCDGTTDQDANDSVVYYADADEDTYGDADATVEACTQPDGYVTDNTDCDDVLANVNPGAVEVCDADDIDEDCDGAADDLDTDGADGKATYYTDSDGDTFGDDTDVGADFCDPPEGVVSNNSDCDDILPGVNPDSAEICDVDDIDEDCDGAADDLDTDGADGKTTYYVDSDGDTFGDANDVGVDLCEPPVDLVSNNTDCDDVLAAVNPDGVEVCDADDIDEDCDGAADDADANGADGKITYFVDGDQDTFGDANDTGSDFCDPPAGLVANNGDCDDVFPSINPGAAEVCDGFSQDEDCDGDADDLDKDGAEGKTTYFVDSDGDTFGDQNDPGSDFCFQYEGFVTDNSDCNDASPEINPGAAEICDAGDIDENCNGVADDDDEGTVAGTTTYYSDADGDTFGDSQSVGIDLCDASTAFVLDNTDCDDSNENVYPDAINYTPAAGDYSTTFAELQYDECGFFGADLSSVEIDNNTNGTFALTEGGVSRSCCFVAGVNPNFTDFICEVVTTTEIGGSTVLTTEQRRSGYWALSNPNTLLLVKTDVATCQGTGCDTVYPTAVPSCEGQSAYHLSRN